MKTRVALALALVASAGAALAAPPKEKVTLARKTRTGDRLTAKESYRSEKAQHWKGEGQGSAGGEELEVTEREYSQEITAESPLTIRRDYKTSTRLKGKPKDERLEPVRTSIHGKTVILKPEGAQIEGGEMSKDDKDGLDNYERVVYSLLPKQEVAVGDEWKVGDEIGRALFRGIFDSTNMKTAGSVKLDSLKTVEGRRAAKLALKVKVELSPTEQIPAVSLDLKGTALFLIDEGIYAEAALDGTMKVEVKKIDQGKETVFTSDEHVTWKLHADPLLAAPAKAPLAKDDELARAKGLSCSKGHKFPNEFAFCASCGKGLDPTTRRCPGGCAPVLRYCPLCGEGLAPIKD